MAAPGGRAGALRGRPAPAASADLALRLLLRHADWWDRLTADDHQLLHGLGGEHGALVAWLETRLHDHGPETWAALDEALHDHELQAAARRIVDPGSLEDRHEPADLERVLHRLWVDELGHQLQQLARQGTDREQLGRMAALNERLRHHKLQLAAPAATPPAGPTV